MGDKAGLWNLLNPNTHSPNLPVHLPDCDRSHLDLHKEHYPILFGAILGDLSDSWTQLQKMLCRDMNEQWDVFIVEVKKNRPWNRMMTLDWAFNTAVDFILPGSLLQARELVSTPSTHKNHLRHFSQNVDSQLCRGWRVDLTRLGWDWVTVLFS